MVVISFVMAFHRSSVMSDLSFPVCFDCPILLVLCIEVNLLVVYSVVFYNWLINE